MISFLDLYETILDNWEIIGLFLLIAILYSSIGFGGGSSYLAVLSLTSLAFVQIRAIALLCNIVVVTGGTYIFVKNKQFNWQKNYTVSNHKCSDGIYRWLFNNWPKFFLYPFRNYVICCGCVDVDLQIHFFERQSPGYKKNSS